MYIAVTDARVYTGNSLALLNHSMDAAMDEDEFRQIGSDRVAILTASDLDFVQDKRKLSTIMFGNFFKKDTLPRNLMIINIILTFVLFVRIGG